MVAVPEPSQGPPPDGDGASPADERRVGDEARDPDARTEERRRNAYRL
ncbi:MAG TPA: hypothetical protein VGU22_06225 [Methylomirabilota bacterium]|jgi:hypothetical protein|nr:hypothetical protein [Methylomirabilota bacterium]